MNENEENTLAAGCVCGRCLPGCSSRWFYPCCGMCMAGKPGFSTDYDPVAEWARISASLAEGVSS